MEKVMTPSVRAVTTDSNWIVRRVKVNRNRTPRDVLNATDRRQYTNREVVDTMPHGEGEEVELVFFKLGCSVNGDGIEEKYDLCGLTAVDPYSLAAYNEVDPAFADKHPNCTQWKDSNGKWCFAAFSCWFNEGRHLGVGRYDDDWGGNWWFAGRRK